MKYRHTVLLIALLLTAPLGIANAEEKHHLNNLLWKSMDTSELQARMQNMQTLMQQAYDSDDAISHQRIMRKHMRELNTGMEIMGGMMHIAEKGHEMPVGQHMDDSTTTTMIKRLAALNERVNMMQQIMKHMMNQVSMMVDHPTKK